MDPISTYFKIFLVGSTYINPQIIYTNIIGKLYFLISVGSELYLAPPMVITLFNVRKGRAYGNQFGKVGLSSLTLPILGWEMGLI